MERGRYWIVATALATVIAVVLEAAWSEELAVRPIALDQRAPGVTAVGELRYAGGLVLRAVDARFGGLSGLSVSADGGGLLAVSDRGSWLAGTLHYDAEGRLTGLDAVTIDALTDAAGRALTARHESDAESLTRTPDGDYLVGFEHDHRIWRYQAAAGHRLGDMVGAVVLPGLAAAEPNGGIEAMVALADGRLLAIAEDTWEGALLVGWLVAADGTVSHVRYRPEGRFHPTDLVQLPSGDVLALERSYTPPAAIAARLRRIPLAAITPGATLAGREIARLASPLTVDNMEGVAAIRTAEGRTRLFLLSDDNFNPLQRTLLLSFTLDE